MNGDRAAADLVLATSLGEAKGGLAIAAAVAVSVSHARPSVLVAELGASGRRGATMLGVELEHGTHDPQTNVTGDDPTVTGKIALAHLNEFPDYYTRLEAMEEQAKRDHGLA
jgi:hypothetical protein